MYAIDDADTFEEVQDMQTQIERRIREIVLVGNKSDCFHGERQVMYEEGQSLAKQWGALPGNVCEGNVQCHRVLSRGSAHYYTR